MTEMEMVRTLAELIALGTAIVVPILKLNSNIVKLTDAVNGLKEANGKLDFSADKTLTLAQSLYEKKVLSYPRTGSRYISEDVFEEIPSRITLLQQYPRFAAIASALRDTPLNRRPVDDADRKSVV